MFKLSFSIKRQIEILGIVSSDTFPKPVRISDLAAFYGVDDITIKRDLKDLRKMGINIHSSKAHGVMSHTVLDDHLISEFIQNYAGLCENTRFLDFSTTKLVKQFYSRALSNFILLQICAERELAAEIEYCHHQSSEINNIDDHYTIKCRKIYPLNLFQSFGHWRVHVQGFSGRPGQYLLEDILKVSITNEKFNPDNKYRSDDLLPFTWGKSIYPEKHKIKLLLSMYLAKKIRSEIFFDEIQMTELPNGLFNFYGVSYSVNISDLAVWIVGHGKGITVLEPAELKQKVISLAKSVLENYEENDPELSF